MRKQYLNKKGLNDYHNKIMDKLNKHKLTVDNATITKNENDVISAKQSEVTNYKLKF